MEYDRQIELVNKWEKVVREWLFLDFRERDFLLSNYAMMFDPVQRACNSTVTFYSDIVHVVELWNSLDIEVSFVKERMVSHSPALHRVLKNLAAMDYHDSKV